MGLTGDTENQIDPKAISKRWRSSLQDVRNKKGAGIASDHQLFVAKSRKFNVKLLKDPKVLQAYQISLQNKFRVLQNLNDSDTDVNTAWELTRDSIIKSCEGTVGY